MALSKIDVANMLTGATPVANGGTALTSGFVNGRANDQGSPIIINGDNANPDALCPIPGGAHCAPNASSASPNVRAGGGSTVQ